MKRSSIVLVFVICLVVIGCPIDPPVDPITTTTSVYIPDMDCDPITTTGRCTDGSWPEACVCYDLSCCGYKVKGRMFYCDRCQPLICDAAASAAITHCYGYSTFISEDGVIDIEEVQETVDTFLEALEVLK